ncbi:ribonuclease H-like domain-containing protein [Tanacetum coccineum]
MRADRFWKKTGKKITIQGSDVAGFDKSKVECFNCHKMDHFARECRSPRSQDKRKRESYKRDPKVEEPASKEMIAINGIGWDWSYMAEEDEASNHALVADEEEVPIKYALMAKSSLSLDNEVYDDSFCSKSCRKNIENLNNKIIKLNEELSDCETDLYNYKRGLSQVEARLVEFKENEIKFCERIRVLERDIEFRDNKIEYLRNELEELKKEKESIDFKIENFENASKDLDKLLGNQKLDKGKKGLGFNEYSAVPPPHTQVQSPPKKDLSWMGLPEFVNDTVTDYSRPSPSMDVSKDVSDELKAIWKSNSASFSKQGGSVEMYRKSHKFLSYVSYFVLQSLRIGLLKMKVKGIPQDNIDDKGYWDSGCSRHMTGNISYLSEYEPYNGGYVSFGHGGGKITGKDIRSANNPMDRENPYGKDGTGKDVELHLYRSMIGSLMYLTTSRPDIMFVVCACARHQVTPKECHLHAVKRIFRYLKGYPKLGLWYPKESPFDLVAYLDSDYGGAN